GTGPGKVVADADRSQALTEPGLQIGGKGTEHLGLSAHPYHGRRAVAGEVLVRGEELEEGQEDLQQMLLHRRGGLGQVGSTRRGRSEGSGLELADPLVEAADEELV